MKSQILHTVLCNVFWRGCRRNFKLITLGSERELYGSSGGTYFRSVINLCEHLILVSICRRYFNQNFECLLSTFERCLRLGEFSYRWRGEFSRDLTCCPPKRSGGGGGGRGGTPI